MVPAVPAAAYTMSRHPSLATDIMRITLQRLLATVAALLAAASISAGATAAGVAAKTSATSNPQAAPVALITGSDRGIGLALVQELTGRGWRVIATCRDPAGAEALKTFAASNPRVVIEALDVSDDAAIDALSARYHDQPIDALINNAGIAGGLGSSGVKTLSAEEFTRVLRVNTYAPLKMSSAFLEQVAASRQKKIVAITSGLGSLFLAPQFSDTTYYSISKAGLNMAMRILQSEAGERGVLVGLVLPGPGRYRYAARLPRRCGAGRQAPHRTDSHPRRECPLAGGLRRNARGREGRAFLFLHRR